MKCIATLALCAITTETFARCVERVESVDSLLESQVKSADIVAVATVVNSVNLSETLGNSFCSKGEEDKNFPCSFPLGPFATLINIDEALKGTVEAKQRIFVFQPNSTTSIKFKKGEQYLLFTSKLSEEFYITSRCTFTRPINEAQEYLTKLRSKKQ